MMIQQTKKWASEGSLGLPLEAQIPRGMTIDSDVMETGLEPSPRNQHGGSEFSLEYLPNPQAVIDELDAIKVNHKFDDELDGQARKRRTMRDDSAVSDQILESLVNQTERATLQNQLLERLEVMSGLQEMQMPVEEDDEPRLGVYNQKERIERLNAYREKRKQRVFGKVRYVLRKRASEGRQRVKGRFAKEEPETEEKIETATNEALKESANWLDGMSLGARKLSNTIRRASAPSPSLGNEEGEHRGSWSSWLLNSRRKSSASAASRRDPNGSMEFLANDDFLVDANELEPDRKRVTSGSSLIFETLPDMS